MTRFDPRPREGGDRPSFPRRGQRQGFDPRPREGGDGLQAIPAQSSCRSFDPRPREGGDRNGRCGNPAWRRFRSTPPRRGRRGRLGRIEPGRIAVSIHAPAKGATSLASLSGRCTVMFRSTPPRRGRLDFLSTTPRPTSRFDPRPREGGDCWVGDRYNCLARFRSTPPRRGRPRADTPRQSQ